MGLFRCPIVIGLVVKIIELIRAPLEIRTRIYGKNVQCYEKP